MKKSKVSHLVTFSSEDGTYLFMVVSRSSSAALASPSGVLRRNFADCCSNKGKSVSPSAAAFRSMSMSRSEWLSFFLRRKSSQDCPSDYPKVPGNES